MSKSTNTSRTSVVPSTQDNRAFLCQIFAWGLVIIACGLAVTVWVQNRGWAFIPFNSYQVFPLLGLLAFSIMWTHYMAGTLRRLLNVDKNALSKYFTYTGWAVLILICLHPGILIYQRFRDGYGLPPHSYQSYVAPGLGWVTSLGSVCLLAFLAYELKRFYGTRPWWHYFQIATDAAMLGIFYHALRIGDELQTGWYKSVWWFYGVTLVAVLIYDYNRKYVQPRLKVKS
jgi:hypothetical protein